MSGISIDLVEGETLGLVGESGCGKSTTGRAMMQVPKPTSGSVVLDDVELTSLDDEAMRRTRPILQMIFQDPISALNPRRTGARHHRRTDDDLVGRRRRPTPNLGLV